MKKYIIILIALCLGISLYVYFTKKDKTNTPIPVYTYKNASSDLVQVDLPYPEAVTGKEFSIIGKARGYWYFEASFPAIVMDKNGKVLWQGPVQAQGDWMTEDFVPFKVDVKVPQDYMGKATIILKNDNPSGLPENEKSVSFPITIEY